MVMHEVLIEAGVEKWRCKKTIFLSSDISDNLRNGGTRENFYISSNNN